MAIFVTVGTYNGSTSSQEITYNGLIVTSPDGINWTILPYTSNYLSGVTYGGGQFVAVGREGSILTSPDGTTWTPQTAAPIANSALTPYLISVIYSAGDGQYVAVGNYVGTNPSTGFILTSSDGKNWNMAAAERRAICMVSVMVLARMWLLEDNKGRMILLDKNVIAV